MCVYTYSIVLFFSKRGGELYNVMVFYLRFIFFFLILHLFIYLFIGVDPTVPTVEIFLGEHQPLVTRKPIKIFFFSV